MKLTAILTLIWPFIVLIVLSIGLAGCTIATGPGWFYGSLFNNIKNGYLYIDPNSVHIEIGSRTVPSVKVDPRRLEIE